MAVVNTSARKAALPAILSTRLDEVRRREASLRLTTGLLDALALFLAALFVALVVDWQLTLFSTSARSALTYLALAAGAVGLVLLAVVPRFKRRTLTETAAQVDRSVPGLEERWETVTRLNASSDPESILGSSALFDRVVAESVERDRLVDPESVVPTRRLRKHRWLLAAAIGANVALFFIDPGQTWVLLRRFCAPTSPVSLTGVTAASGDLAVARGEPVRLEATLAGRPRDKADLFLRNSQGQVTTVPLVAVAPDGTRFAHAIDAADEPFSYRFRAGDGQTGWHNVSIYDRPRLTSVELRLQPPEYTHLPAVTKSELPTSLRAVEGSQLEVAFSVDQPLDRFDLQLGTNSAARLSPKAGDANRYVFQTKLDKTLRLTPVFVSQHGLTNLRPPSCQVIVYPDRAPDVAIISPEREISLRPTDEVTIEFAARDDFGVVKAELVAFVGNQPDIENALVLPPQNANDAKNAKTAPGPKSAAEMKAGADGKDAADSKDAADTKDAGDSKDAAPAGPQQKSADAKSARAIEAKPSPVTKSKTDGKTEAARRAAAPRQTASPQTPSPQTVVMPIPLGGQTGEKNVRGKIKLDLKRFQLKQGQQLQYMVRVYDSRSARSNGQSYGDSAQAQDSKSPDSKSQGSKSRASTANSAAKQPSSAQSSPQSPAAGKTAAEEQRRAQDQMMPDQKMTSQKMADQKMAAGRQAAKAPVTAASRRPAGQASPKETPNGTPKKSRSDSLADAAKIDASASRQKEQGADRKANPRDAKQAAPESSSSAQERASGKKQSPADETKDAGQVTGAPRPEDAMTRRQLDVDSQSTSSSTMKIQIDKWAGSFEGQQRRKLEILIDPVLKELDAALAKAIEELRPLSEDLASGKNTGKKPGDEFKKSLRAADTHIARGQSLVADLVQKSDGTPYAFIGLQLVDITELHISPARLDVKAAKAETPDRKERVQQAAVHLTRAREMLADLTRKYESVKRDLRMADDLQRVKTMYQVFIEDAMAFLASNRPTLNPKDRKMAQLELDEEFMKQYRELAQEWEKTLAELAKALAKDPRLLARYMNLSRRSADSLRDQLTLLNLRQQELLVPVQQLTGAGTGAGAAEGNSKPATADDAARPADDEPAKPRVAQKRQTEAGLQTIRGTLSRDLAEIAAGTIGVQEDLGTWLPQKFKDDPRSLPLREQAQKVSTLATLAAMAAGSPNEKKATEAGKDVAALALQLKSFETALAQFANSDDAQIAVPVNKRLARVRTLEQLTAAWTEKNAHVAGGRLHRALELDQHRLSEDTLVLSAKLDRAMAEFAGLSEDVLRLVDEVKDALRYDVLVDQMSAELRLREANLATAQTHQKKAIEGFARAEERFNKLIDRIIEEQDKTPPEVPDLDNVQLATLEELLARLEAEQNLAELLGVPDRPTNLQTLRDWLMSNRSGAGSSGARNQSRLVEKARRDALRDVRKAQKTDAHARPLATASHWNTLGSRLEDAVRQGRGNTPPRQYRRAIERYFELISGAKNATDTAAPAVPPKENGKENAK
jgi:hypothetical protein